MKINKEIQSVLKADLEHLCSTKVGRRALIGSMPFLMMACATKTSDRYREGSNKGQKTSITVKDEIKMAKEYMPKMTKDYPIIKDPHMSRYISSVGNKIVLRNNLASNPYKYEFYLVNSKSINAFALPAGKVFVTSALLKATDSEAELAGVLGHEVGHIQARHTAERMEYAKKSQNKTLWYTLGGVLAGGALGYGLGKMLCSPKDQECLQRVAKYGAMAGGAGGLLIQKYGFMANSQEDEMEADRIGFKTSVKAGYHKDHVGKFYNKLLVMEKKHKKGNDILAGFADALSTHPPSEKRVEQMHQMSKKIALSKGSTISTKEYEKIKSELKKSYS